MSFLTLEDINTTQYHYGKIVYYEINTAHISTTEDYTDVKIDFVKATRTINPNFTNSYDYTFEIDNSSWTGGYFLLTPNGAYYQDNIPSWSNQKMKVTTVYKSMRLFLLLIPDTEFTFDRIWHRLDKYEYTFDYSYYNPTANKHIQGLNIPVYNRVTGQQYDTITELTDWGLNAVPVDNNNDVAYLYAFLVRTDFKFNCNQVLTNGKVNTVPLGVDNDYKPSGAMVGDYAPYITVVYGESVLPVVWNPTANDYTFDIDLTNRERENDVVLNVRVDVNEVLNSTETEIRLHTRFETINDLTKVNTLFTNGGIGRLGADITLTGDLTVQEDIYLIGNDYTIDLDGHKIIVPSDKTFKASNVNFHNGVNTIQQNTGSKVGLTDCTFGYCTGLGSVIDCQVDLDSLENPTDFTTTLTRCIIGECETAILHGGDLTITDCRVQGIISDPSYPYFLYQTDGNATILQTEFTLISNTQISTDIEFNSCIFICGETAQVNGYSHQELQNNNITQFLETQRNSSVINVTYLYTPINDYITLYSEKGYCHSVSDVDYVFKTNVTPTRSD